MAEGAMSEKKLGLKVAAIFFEHVLTGAGGGVWMCISKDFLPLVTGAVRRVMQEYAIGSANVRNAGITGKRSNKHVTNAGSLI